MQEAAAQAEQGILANKRRRKIDLQGDPNVRLGPIHIGGWGQPKRGKTHFGLSARTSTVNIMENTAPTSAFDPGGMKVKEVLIPSRPLRIAYANFDRDADTVYAKIDPSTDIVEEQFFVDGLGDLIIAPDGPMMNQLLQRLDKFLTEAQAEGYELFFVDGGTVLWQDVRFARVESAVAPGGTTPDGQPRHLPRQYAPANTTMRHEVMRPLYSAKMHTYITREAGERWSGQNTVMEGPAEDGGVALRPDGWRNTGHLIDVDLQFRSYAQTGGNSVRDAVYGETVLEKAFIGRKVVDPRFALIYEQQKGVPLLGQEDKETFLEAERKLASEPNLSLGWSE